MPFQNIFSKKPIPLSQELNIIVDTREKQSQLVPFLLEKKFKIEYKILPIADYLINGIAIERKTISDLKSSIINKRIFQQLLELKQYPQHFLLIEGNPTELYSPPLHENATRGFLLAVALEYQTPLIFTHSPIDTAKYFQVLAKRKPNNISLRPTKILKSKKEQALFILEGFPKVGPTKAKSLIKKFNSLNKIFQAPLQDLQSILGKNAQDFFSLINKPHK
jgi:ERCC4-type nuclease